MKKVKTQITGMGTMSVMYVSEEGLVPLIHDRI